MRDPKRYVVGARGLGGTWRPGGEETGEAGAGGAAVYEGWLAVLLPALLAALRPMAQSGGQAHRPRCSDEALGSSRGSSAFAYLVPLQASRRRVWSPAQPRSASAPWVRASAVPIGRNDVQPQPRLIRLPDAHMRLPESSCDAVRDASPATTAARRGGTGACRVPCWARGRLAQRSPSRPRRPATESGCVGAALIGPADIATSMRHFAPD